jgi:Transposase and inactivated derivatives
MNIFQDEFNSFYELLEYFKDEQTCIDYFAFQKWEGKPCCPHCECDKVYCFSDKRRYKCSNCRKQFSVRTGTIFQDSNLSLKKWFIAIYLISSHKKGISSHQLARDLKVTQKTAWFVLHRIRYAFGECNIDVQLSDTVEIDEAFIGGKNKNRHWNKKVKNSQGRSFKDKTPIFGMLQRGGFLIAKVVSDTKVRTLRPLIEKYISEGSIINTDDWNYGNLSKKYIHKKVDHSSKVYAVGDVYTNTIEGFWGIFKRGMIGIYNHVSRKHLQKYVDEFVFRYNYRKLKEGERVNKLLSLCCITMTYKNLIYE